LVGVDTNIIVRHLVQDDERQCGLVRALIEATDHRDPLILNPVVVAETVWVLERTYKVAPAEARRAVELVLEAREFHMPGTVAIGDWQSWFGYADCDFSDVIIAQLNRENGCSATLTFDQHAAKRVPGMELLS
jgi:predicted nucleic-acid-binding protein